MKIPGNISISRVHDNRSDEAYMEIRIHDEISHTEFVEMRISLKSMMEAISGVSARPGTIELRGLTNVGRKLEVKEELLNVTEWYNSNDILKRQKVFSKALFKAAAEYEVAGWEGSIDEHFNHHRLVQKADGFYYRTTFRRYVEATLEDIEQITREQKERV